MSKLILAARDGFIDSLLLALAIPATILRELASIARKFLAH